MMTFLVSVFYHFVSNTIILFISGCVSLFAITGLFSGLIFLAVKHLNYYCSEKILVSRTEEKKYQSTANLLLTNSEHKSSSTSEDRALWFVIRNESDERKVLKEVRKHTKITVASNSSPFNSEKNEDVREFLEHLIGSIISAKLDDVPLTPLSNNIKYENLFSKYHAKLSSVITKLYASLYSTVDSESLSESIKPSNLYIRLKSIIKEISEDVVLLPPFKDYESQSEPVSIETSFESQRYEDILSTAVINKIVSTNQNKNDSYTSANNVNSDDTDDVRSKSYEDSYSSSPKKLLSLMIEEHIEEITTKYRSSEDEDEEEPIIDYSTNISLIGKHHRTHFPELGKDIVDSYNSYDEDNVTEIVSNVDSWEDNWLFQRKKKSKLKNTVSQVAVPMLVPNPSEKYRALIGDVDVDETSDLSECSDSFLEDLADVFKSEKSDTKTNYIYKYDFQSNLETPTLKTSHFDNESENLGTDHDQDSSGVTSISRDISDIYSFSSLSPCRSEEDSLLWTEIREAKNEDIFLTQDDSGEGSLETQTESEYFNEYNLDSNAQKTNLQTHDSNSSKLLGIDIESSLRELSTPPKPGTIAEREHLKWEQAAPLPNNPYSKENIEKRNINNFLSKTCVNSFLNNQNELYNEVSVAKSTETLSNINRYGRDYYVNVNFKEKAKVSCEVKESGENTAINTKQDQKLLENEIPEDLRINGNPENKTNTNLVRVSSWSDRKRPDIEIRKRLPSVKELAKQFSVQTNFNEVEKTPISRNKMVHSLTARSMSREFREGLKNNIGKTYNRNVTIGNETDGYDKLEEISGTDENCKNTDNTISLEENI